MLMLPRSLALEEVLALVLALVPLTTQQQRRMPIPNVHVMRLKLWHSRWGRKEAEESSPSLEHAVRMHVSYQVLKYLDTQVLLG